MIRKIEAKDYFKIKEKEKNFLIYFYSQVYSECVTINENIVQIIRKCPLALALHINYFEFRNMFKHLRWMKATDVVMVVNGEEACRYPKPEIATLSELCYCIGYRRLKENESSFRGILRKSIYNAYSSYEEYKRKSKLLSDTSKYIPSKEIPSYIQMINRSKNQKLPNEKNEPQSIFEYLRNFKSPIDVTSEDFMVEIDDKEGNDFTHTTFTGICQLFGYPIQSSHLVKSQYNLPLKHLKFHINNSKKDKNIQSLPIANSLNYNTNSLLPTSILHSDNIELNGISVDDIKRMVKLKSPENTPSPKKSDMVFSKVKKMFVKSKNKRKYDVKKSMKNYIKTIEKTK